MAAPTRHSLTTNDLLQTSSHRDDPYGSDSRRLIPSGPCKFKYSSQSDFSFCGCQRYFQISYRNSEHLPDPLAGDGQHWCACGHHSCFHSEQQGNNAVDPSQQRQNVQEHKDNSHRDLLHSHKTRISPAHHCSNDQEPSNGFKFVHDFSNPVEGDVELPQALVRTAERNAKEKDACHLLLPKIPSQCVLDTEGYPRLQSVGHNDSDREQFHFRLTNWKLGSKDSIRDPTLLLAQDDFPEVPPGDDPVSTYKDLQIVASQSAIPAIERADLEDWQPLNEDDYAQSATEILTPPVKTTPVLGCDEAIDKELSKVKETAMELKRKVELLKNQETVISRGMATSGATRNGHCRTQEKGVEGNDRECERQLDRERLSFVFQALDKVIHANEKMISKIDDFPSREVVLRLTDRVESLENASFSIRGSDEAVEKVELLDGRITDLESNMEDIIKWYTSREDSDDGKGSPNYHSAVASSSVRSESLNHSINCSFSFSNDLLRNRLTTLESRLLNIETAVAPCLHHPWEIEVILIPWGRNLRGLWFSPRNPSVPSEHLARRTSEDVKQTSSFPPSWEQRTFEKNRSTWNARSIQEWTKGNQDWLVAKACASTSEVYQRLKSRGFIERISVNGGGAQDFERAIEEALSSLLETLSNRQELTEAHQSRTSTYADHLLGLESRFIPLRKRRQFSMLQHLRESDLVSSSLWDASFLQASVLMNPHKRLKTLFITTRSGYLQPHQETSDWTWDMIKHLPRKTSSHPSGDRRESSYSEEFWKWNLRLDGPLPSLNPESEKLSGNIETTGLVQSLQPHHSLREDYDDSCATSPLSCYEVQQAEPLSPPSDMKPQKSIQQKFTASSEIYGKYTSTRLRPGSIEIESSKRRRISSPPNTDCPSSPFFEESRPVFCSNYQSEKSNIPRAETPTAYATPYSGTHILPNIESGSSASQTTSSNEKHDESYSNTAKIRRRMNSDAWEGVGETESSGHDMRIGHSNVDSSDSSRGMDMTTEDNQ